MCDKRTVLKKLDRRAEIKRKMDELQFELDSCEDYIKNWVEKNSEDGKIEVGDYKISYTMTGRDQVSAKSLREKYPAIFEELGGKFNSYKSLRVTNK